MLTKVKYVGISIQELYLFRPLVPRKFSPNDLESFSTGFGIRYTDEDMFPETATVASAG